MDSPVNIICMKWGKKYGPEYVNKLHGMISRNLTVPFILTCFTDDNSGVNPEIIIKPLPSLDLPKDTPERGWNKLSTLQENLGGLSGDVLFLDLDVVIVSNIDDLFTYPASFAIIKDTKLKRSVTGNSSVYRFKIGEHSDILENFQNDFELVKKEHRNEQAYLSAEVYKKKKLSYWPAEWCPSFKYHCIKPWPFSYFMTPVIPLNSKIIIFHGHPEPHEAITGITHKWYRPVRPTPWVEEYWNE